jgi:predicted lipoprotein with Yx(FWY)xxD motif
MKQGQIVVFVVAIAVIATGLVWWRVSMGPAASPAAPVPANTNVNNQNAANIPPASTPKQATKVVLRTDPKLGKYLTDDNGRALYVFAKDADGASACAGGCLNVWPVFYLAKVSIGPGLDMGDFKTIARPDGTIQTTYYGWPLYYYAGDAAAGDVKGEGVNKLWFVAKPDYTVVFANQNGADYLVDADTGLTLYQYSKDTANVSNCNGVCAKNWPIFYVKKIVAPSFLDATKFGMLIRVDKTGQTSFNELPLYHYLQDKAQGDQKGNGYGGVWSIVNPF